MTNKFLGEVALPVGDTTYTLRMSVREMIAIEAQYGLSFNECLALALNGDKTKITDCVSLLAIMLKRHHPDIDREKVCDIIDQTGLAPVVNAMIEAINLSMPKKSEGAESPNPEQPKAE